MKGRRGSSRGGSKRKAGGKEGTKAHKRIKGRGGRKKGKRGRESL